MSDTQPPPKCSSCDYDLTGLIKQGSSTTCPECGHITNYNSYFTRFSWEKTHTFFAIRFMLPSTIVPILAILIFNPLATNNLMAPTIYALLSFVAWPLYLIYLVHRILKRSHQICYNTPEDWAIMMLGLCYSAPSILPHGLLCLLLITNGM